MKELCFGNVVRLYIGLCWPVMLLLWNDGVAPDEMNAPPPASAEFGAMLPLMTQPVNVGLEPLSLMYRPPPAPAAVLPAWIGVFRFNFERRKKRVTHHLMFWC